jgi:hypothetical protein
MWTSACPIRNAPKNHWDRVLNQSANARNGIIGIRGVKRFISLLSDRYLHGYRCLGLVRRAERPGPIEQTVTAAMTGLLYESPHRSPPPHPSPAASDSTWSGDSHHRSPTRWGNPTVRGFDRCRSCSHRAGSSDRHLLRRHAIPTRRLTRLIPRWDLGTGPIRQVGEAVLSIHGHRRMFPRRSR